MAKTTGIAWCDSTFNPWIGCTRVGPGCDHCYAEQQDSRKRWGGTTHWGSGVPRHRTSASYWKQPLAWNAQQEDFRRQGDAPPWNVFCASLADVFDNEVPEAWRLDLWTLIASTPHLSWLLVTKRIGNVKNMAWEGWRERWPDNIRLLITVCNQEEADRDIPKLLALPCKNGISYEPALGPIQWRWTPYAHEATGESYREYLDRKGGVNEYEALRKINWIIIGGESGPKARPFDIAWARGAIARCKAAGVPVFMKQVGSCPIWGDEDSLLGRALREGGYVIKDRAGADPSEWPDDIRIREFP